MKKLSKLVLFELESRELSGRQMKNVKGGVNSCLCGCCYAGSGGSSDQNNGNANCRSSSYSPCGDATYGVC
jgi:natural product precursor